MYSRGGENISKYDNIIYELLTLQKITFSKNMKETKIETLTRF